MDIDIKEKPYICYKVTNTVNGKGYIGQTRKSLRVRWKRHVGSAFWKTTKKTAFALHLAIRKYSAGSFVIKEITRAATLGEILLVEQQMIKEHNTLTTGYGYNRTKGGEVGYVLTEETRARMSRAHLGQTRGPRDVETKRKISETKKKLGHGPSLYCNQKRRETGTGKPVSAAVREKIRRALKGRSRPPEVVAKIQATRRKKRESTSG